MSIPDIIANAIPIAAIIACATLALVESRRRTRREAERRQRDRHVELNRTPLLDRINSEGVDLLETARAARRRHSGSVED